MSSAATARVRDALARQPRLLLATLPTPLYDATRLRDALGGSGRCPRILIKRDDLTALGLGGNKARKLEYLVADAQAHGAHHVDHDRRGAIQSRADDGGGRVRGRHAVCARAHLVLEPIRRSRATCCSTSCTAPRFGSCRRSTRCLPSAMTNRWSPRWWPKNRRRAAHHMSSRWAARAALACSVTSAASAELVDQLRDAGRHADRGCITPAAREARRRASRLARSCARRRIGCAASRSAAASRRRSSARNESPTRPLRGSDYPSASSLRI